MITKKITSTTLLLGIILLFANYSFAQFNYKIDGIVKENGKFLQGSIVTVYNFNSEKIKEIITPATGTFTFSLKPDEEYSILITKEGYTTAKLIYSTIGITEEEAKKIKASSNPEIEIFPLPQDPKLLAKINELQNKPMMSFYYSTDDKKMIGDDDLLESMKQEFVKLQTAAFEEKNKGTIASQKEASYSAAIAKADKEFAAQNYKAAKTAYNEALNIKTNEQYPKTKIAEVDLLIEQNLEKEKTLKEKELNDKYTIAIAKADKAFTTKDFSGAKLAYTEAASIKITEQYPKNKIKEIESLLADAALKDKTEKDKLAKEKEINDKYNAAITKADAAFFIKDYKAAKSAYNDALMIKPTEIYPQEKITESNKFIMEIAEKERLQKEKAEADAAEKERIAKEKQNAELAEKERIEKEKAAADALLKEKLAKEKAIADAATEKARLEKEKVEAEVAEKNRIAKEKAIAEAAESDKIAKEKAALIAAEKEKQAKEKAIAEAAAEKTRLEKEKAEVEIAEKNRIAKEKAIAEADRIAKEKATLIATEKEKLAKEKAIADAAEKERLAKEEEKRAFERTYKKIISKADSTLNIKDYNNAKQFYNEAISLKADDEYPKTQLKRVDILIASSELYKNDLAKKYPIGVTEEITKEGNTSVTKRIVVIGNKGYLYEKKETNFGAIYYFKDGIAINQQQFDKDTQKK